MNPDPDSRLTSIVKVVRLSSIPFFSENIKDKFKYKSRFIFKFVKVSKSVTGRKLQHIRGELFGVIGAEAFGKILIMNREIKS